MRKDMRVVAFVPIKMNNERLPGKNVKLIGGKPLITRLLDKLVQVDGVDEVYVFCSDRAVQGYLPPRVHFLERAQTLDKNETRMNEIIDAFVEVVDADVYLLTHATSPFVSIETFSKGISAVCSKQYDSALSVEALQEFLWYDGKPLTYDPSSIPRTQDLKSVYRETSGAYVFTKEVALGSRRIGRTPFFIECNKIEAIDIDDAMDFEMAEAICGRLCGVEMGE